MRWNYETWADEKNRNAKWHKWFAWYPVSISRDGRTYWLEYVLRKRIWVSVPPMPLASGWLSFYRGIEEWDLAEIENQNLVLQE